MIGFGKYSLLKNTEEAVSLTDKSLVKIDPQEDGFFDAVINFDSTNSDINEFIKTVSEVKDAKLETFYKPIYDPSIDGDIIVYRKGGKRAVGYSYNWWVETASKMPTVEGRHWHLATEYQYYAFLVWLINQLVKDGKSVEVALNMVVLNSSEFCYEKDGEYRDYEDSQITGLKCVCGVYDLVFPHKILACSNENYGGFWLASGNDYEMSTGIFYPLAGLSHQDKMDDGWFHSIGLLVL